MFGTKQNCFFKSNSSQKGESSLLRCQLNKNWSSAFILKKINNIKIGNVCYITKINSVL